MSSVRIESIWPILGLLVGSPLSCFCYECVSVVLGAAMAPAIRLSSVQDWLVRLGSGFSLQFTYAQRGASADITLVDAIELHVLRSQALVCRSRRPFFFSRLGFLLESGDFAGVLFWTFLMSFVLLTIYIAIRK